ncbi:methyltransferase 7A [Brachionus plicatilis]|uniref:Methyltransferase 7A n=1 Tax=Brachionus plicatilis TaxID=10195 RepID=A0A3M7RL32_BRAPC|nr:methyltransferase 7A [Brachionus plicatilis]
MRGLNFMMNFVHSNLEVVKPKLFDEAISQVKTNKKNDRLEILELGIGTGENFKHFPKGSNVTILDKTDIFLPYLNESIKKNNRQDLNVSKLVVSKAEEMVGIESDSMDVVVHTFILCSVNDYKKVMSEIYRVLKPGGVCIFIEHSIDNENKPRKYMQKVIEPALSDCKFLDMKKVLSSGPYDHLELKKYRVNRALITFINPIVYGYGFKSLNK